MSMKHSTNLPPGVTYRMADYWASAGLLVPAESETREVQRGGRTVHITVDRLNPGSGMSRNWTDNDRAKMYGMAKLKAAGLDIRTAAYITERVLAGELTVKFPDQEIWITVPEDFLSWE